MISECNKQDVSDALVVVRDGAIEEKTGRVEVYLFQPYYVWLSLKGTRTILQEFTSFAYKGAIVVSSLRHIRS